MDIIGLGTVAMDVIMQVDSLPKEDGFCLVNKQSYLEGGSATNVIVQASRLGAKCGFISQIGDDGVGKGIKNSLERENVITESMIVKKGGTSLHTLVVVDQEGKKFIMLNMGDVFLTLRKEDVDTEFIKTGKIFYTDLLPGEPAIDALKKAKESGLKTVINVQIGLPLMENFGVSKDAILDSLKYVDVFAPCREAFYALTGTDDYQKGVKQFSRLYDGLLLLTLGEKGSLAVTKDFHLQVPVFEVQVVDTTGAGDSFIGAFMYAFFIRKMKIKEAMEFSSVWRPDQS